MPSFRMSHSYAFGIWVPRHQVSEAHVSEAIEAKGRQFWGQGLSATLYLLAKPASTFISVPLDDHKQPLSLLDAGWDEPGAELARRLQTPVYALFAFAGATNFLAVSAFDASGASRWTKSGEEFDAYGQMAKELSLKFERLSLGVQPVLEPVGEDWQLAGDVLLDEVSAASGATPLPDEEDDIDELDAYELNLDSPTLSELDAGALPPPDAVESASPKAAKVSKRK